MAFLKNCWYVIGWSHEFPADGLSARTALGEPLVIYRRDDGTPVVFEDRCCHRLAPLSMGQREGNDLRCMYHGLKFAPSGRCIEIPGQEKVPASYCVRSYPAVERASWLWVWMGAPEAADESLIPLAVGLDDPSYILRAERIDYKANYLLINDNLLDLSHISYVHRAQKSLGNGNMAWANERSSVKRLPRGIRFERWQRNHPMPERQRTDKIPSDVTVIDQWSTYDFVVPGIFVLKTEYHPTGTADASDGGPPATKPIHSGITCQAILPVDEDHSSYFYSFGPAAETGTEALSDGMMEMLIFAFQEDRAIIEAQQATIKKSAGREMRPTIHDAGVNQFRRLLNQMIEAQSGAIS